MCNYPNCDGGYATGYCHNDCCGSRVPDLVDALTLAAEHIKDLDGGDPKTETGWKSEELLEVWLKARAAISTVRP